LDELVEAIEALIEDIDVKIEENDGAYNERSLQNQSEVTRLTGLITDAEVHIANAENILNNILYPTLEQLQQRVVDINDEINENNEYVARITYEREEAHEAYEERVAEHNEALAAIDECLEILSQFGAGNLSLIQTKKVQASLTRVTKTLKRGIESSMIKALVALASSEFADSSAILRVVHALEDVKAETQNALELEHTNEATSVAQWEHEVEERTKENSRLARELNITQGEVDGTENRIAEKENILAIQQQDLANFTAELEAEHAAFEEATEFYEDVRAELVREQAVGHDALAIVKNAGFGGNLVGNVGL